MSISPHYSSYGFIITRHVNSQKTNKYWNQCVRCIRHFYPFRKIVIIDDNSNFKFVKPEIDISNILIIHSQYKQRGEMLPYYYYYNNKFFDHAVIIHDSVFFHKRVHFEKILNMSFLSLWHFNSDSENIQNTLRIANYLKNNHIIKNKLKNHILGIHRQKWYGCFGVQSFISHSFLSHLQNKYNIINMLQGVSCRSDRCSLERIFGVLAFLEYNTNNRKSLFGNIFNHQQWGYNYDEYERDLYKNKRLPRNILKVWTGR